VWSQVEDRSEIPGLEEREKLKESWLLVFIFTIRSANHVCLFVCLSYQLSPSTGPVCDAFFSRYGQKN
jgi:hypothetical protein